MNHDTRSYGAGTSVTQSFPWGMFVSARVLCTDGVVRTVKRISPTADTCFSIPASVTVKGKTVSGYVTFETMGGSSAETGDDPAVAKFIAYRYGKNFGAIVPAVTPREISKAAPSDAGCYVDGHWGQYATAHMIERATEFGYTDAEAEFLAHRHLHTCGKSTSPAGMYLTDTEHEVLHECAGDAEEWLNSHAAPEGYSFGWHDGEFFLRQDDCGAADIDGDRCWSCWACLHN
jgi:hypothetical protein